MAKASPALVVPVDDQVDGRKAISRDFQGIPILIEFEAGDLKPDEDDPYPGSGWPMYADYGYIKDTLAADGEQLDCFVGPNPDSENVYVAYLMDSDDSSYGSEPSCCIDEPKVLFGFDDCDEATEFMYRQYGEWKTGPIMTSSLKNVREDIELQKMKFEKEMAYQADNNTDGTTSDVATGEEINDYGQAGDNPTIVVSL